MNSRVLVAVAALVCVAGAAGAAPPKNIAKAQAGELELMAQLPKDPIIAWDSRIGNGGEIYDSMLALVRRFVPAEELPQVEEGIATMNDELGFSLRDDLLAYLGPEMAGAIDLPPIDMAAGSVMSGAPDGIATVTNGIGLWMQVSDPAKVDAALRAIFAKAEARMSEIDGIVEVGFGPEDDAAQAGGPAPPPMSLFYGMKDGVLSMGFSADTVRDRLGSRPAGEGLADGDDFQRVTSHLDGDPRSLVYINLPKLQQMIGESEMVKGMLSSKAELQPAMEVLLDPEMATSGIGATTTEVDGGVRQVTYGPSWIGSGVATTGIVAAIAVPNLLNAIQRGRTKRTMADMRSLATAAEAFAVDNNRYPATDGWVEVATIGDQLAPMYIRTLPTTDGWDHAILYWSDGSDYRLVSRGKDGVLDQQWDGELESVATTDFNADIVYGNGAFIVYPSMGD
jgi:hypothetical protein